MHRKRGIDRGTEEWGLGRVSLWGLGCPILQKTTYVPPSLQHIIVLPLIFGIWFGVFPIGTARGPIQLQSATRRPDCGLSE